MNRFIFIILVFAGASVQTFAFNNERGVQTAFNVVDTTVINKPVFFCEITDGKTVFNINGKEYGPYSMNSRDFHFNSPDDFSFMYKTTGNNEESVWINISGKEHGPFENGELFSNNIFAFKRDGEWFENNNGILTGPFDYATPHQRKEANRGAISPDGKQFIMEEAYDEDIQCQLLNINGTITKVKGCSGDYQINNSGQYTYFFWNNKKKLYVCINGRNSKIGNIHSPIPH